ncbi:VCBS repeat-containing protein [Piscibacillus salipiscarius]|uniref:VCBS repeat-containing protein n=2 Tax=Piscibacillus salipiscarius TaxID=299480 RepID=A0ABW5QEH2_9BACI
MNFLIYGVDVHKLLHHDFKGELPTMYEIVAMTQGDVTGDGISDTVYVMGFRESDVSIIRKMSLVINDGATNLLTNIYLEEDMGYDPGLFLGDFTGDGVSDIFLNIPSGGSGATSYNYIYSFVNQQARLLFDSNVYNAEYSYTVTYQDDYKVEVVSEKNQARYMIDLSLRDSEYLNEIYYEDGTLKEPITGWVDPVSGLYPIGYSSRSPVYLLLAYQQIAGRYHADSIGYVQNRLKWDGESFVLDFQYVGIFGSQID